MALKHTYEKAFSTENGMRRNVPKVVVAITDGRSQDEVKKNAAKLHLAGKGHGVCCMGINACGSVLHAHIHLCSFGALAEFTVGEINF